MGFSHFIYDYVMPELPGYLAVLAVTTVIFTLIYRHVICDIKEISVLWTCYFGEVFSITDVVFMHMKGLISDYYFINFMITTIILYTSILFFQKLFSVKAIYKNRVNYCKRYTPEEKDILIIKRYSTILFLLYVLFSILQIRLIGIRSFEKVGGGTGAIIRFLWILTPMIHICSVFLFFSKYKKRAIVYLVATIVLSFFFGSKSAVINLMFLFFAYVLLNPKESNALRFVEKYAIVLVLIGVVAGSILYELLNPFGEPFYIGILHRFVAYGDVYAFAYPYNAINKVFSGGVSFLQYLTSDFLTTFRIADRSFSDVTNFSGRLVEYLAGPGINEGPNPRFNALGLAFFGFTGSILFAILCGVIFAIVHRYFVKSINHSFKRQLFAYVILSRLINLEQDASLLPQFFTEMVLLFLIYCILYVYGEMFVIHTIKFQMK